MRRLLILTAAMLVLLIAVSPISAPVSTLAQSSTPAATQSANCKPADLISRFAALKSSGDNDKDLTELQKLAAQVESQTIACHGLTFKGTGIVKVIGPVTLPAGDYKFTTTTVDYVTLEAKMSGDCLDDSLLANVRKDEGNTGSEKLITATTDCKFYIQPSNVDTPWTLTIEPIQ